MADNLEDSTCIDYCWFKILAESHLSVAREGEVPAQEMEVQLDYRNDINQTIMASRAEACDCEPKE